MDVVWVQRKLSYNQPTNRIVLVAAAKGDSEEARHVLVRAPDDAAYRELFTLPEGELFHSSYISERTGFGYFVRLVRIAAGAFDCVAITRFDLVTGALQDITRVGAERVPWPVEVCGELADGSGLIVKACVALRGEGSARRASYALAVVAFATPTYRMIAELNESW